MICPKCRSEDIFENIEYDLSRCRTCQYRWTPWQQDEITRLEAELKSYKDYTGFEMFRSDFQTAAQMREALRQARKELAKYKLKWQQGFIPCDGEYWRGWRPKVSILDVRISALPKGTCMPSPNDYFAGPIPRPEEEK